MPRASLAAVVKRQILEGVQAVVKLYRGSLNTGKIPLQLFDRSGGVDNVRFEGMLLEIKTIPPSTDQCPCFRIRRLGSPYRRRIGYPRQG